MIFQTNLFISTLFTICVLPFQMHIVNKASVTVNESVAIAVLGFFIEVSLCFTHCFETLIQLPCCLDNLWLLHHGFLSLYSQATNDTDKPESWKNLTSFLSNISTHGTDFNSCLVNRLKCINNNFWVSFSWLFSTGVET